MAEPPFRWIFIGVKSVPLPTGIAHSLVASAIKSTGPEIWLDEDPPETELFRDSFSDDVDIISPAVKVSVSFTVTSAFKVTPEALFTIKFPALTLAALIV